MANIKVGIIGLGMMGVFHTEVYKTLSNVEVVGGYDAFPEQGKKFEEATGIKAFDDLNALLSKVSAVSICTPDNLHKEPILKAFAAGVKCLVEKPLAVSSVDCEEILSKMPDPTYLMVGHILRFDPRLWHAKRAVESGELGNIRSVNIWRHNSREGGQKIGKRTSVTWFLSIHDIDIVMWITGQKVKKVFAMGRKNFIPFYDYVVSAMELDDGTLVTMENSFILPDERLSGMDGGLKIIGDKGMIEVDLNHNSVRLSTKKTGRSLMQDTYHWPVINGVHYGDLRVELESFIDAVVSGKVPLVTAEEATEAVRVIERIEEYLDSNQ